jgi:hypothetical protein
MNEEAEIQMLTQVEQALGIVELAIHALDGPEGTVDVPPAVLALRGAQGLLEGALGRTV